MFFFRIKFWLNISLRTFCLKKMQYYTSIVVGDRKKKKKILENDYPQLECISIRG